MLSERIARVTESRSDKAARAFCQGERPAAPRATSAHGDARTSARLISFALVTIGGAVMAGTVAGLAYSAIVETFARVAAALAL